MGSADIVVVEAVVFNVDASNGCIWTVLTVLDVLEPFAIEREVAGVSAVSGTGGWGTGGGGRCAWTFLPPLLPRNRRRYVLFNPWTQHPSHLCMPVVSLFLGTLWKGGYTLHTCCGCWRTDS